MSEDVKWEEVQSDLFQESGVNWSTDFETKIPELAAYFKLHGWGDVPPIHATLNTMVESELEDFNEAVEDGYEHELAYSRPLHLSDIGTVVARIEDGHNRAYAAREAGIPLRVKVWATVNPTTNTDLTRRLKF